MPRAFHQASFIGTTDGGQYQMLLVGGATADPTNASFGVNTGAAPGTRLVPFDTSGSFPNPLPTSAAPAELLTYDPATRSVHADAARRHSPPRSSRAAPSSPTASPSPAASTGWACRWPRPSRRSTAVSARRRGRRWRRRRRTVAPPFVAHGRHPDAAVGRHRAHLGRQHHAHRRRRRARHRPRRRRTRQGDHGHPAAEPPTQFHTATAPAGRRRDANDHRASAAASSRPTPNGGRRCSRRCATQALPSLLTVTPAGVVSVARRRCPATPSTPAASIRRAIGPPAGRAAVDARPRPGPGQRRRADGAGRGVSCNDCDGGSDFRCATGQASMSHAAVDGRADCRPLQMPRYGHTADPAPRRQRAHRRWRRRARRRPRMLARRRAVQPAPGGAAVRSRRAACPIPTIRSPSTWRPGAARAPGQPLSEQSLCHEL